MLLGTITLTAVAITLGICLGSTQVSPASFFQALLSGDTASSTYRIVIHSRLPRVLGALLAGSALAVSGAILQAVLQNPLASPNIIGVNTGAGLLVLLCSAFFPSQEALLPFAAFLGALLTALLIFALAMGNGVSKVTLVLTGIAMSSILGAGMNCIMILYPDAYIGASTFLVGGLSAVTLKGLRVAAFYILIGLALAMFLRRDMNIVSLGSNARPLFRYACNPDSLFAHSYCCHLGWRCCQLCRTFRLCRPHCSPRHSLSDWRRQCFFSADQRFRWRSLCDFMRPTRPCSLCPLRNSGGDSAFIYWRTLLYLSCYSQQEEWS